MAHMINAASHTVMILFLHDWEKRVPRWVKRVPTFLVVVVFKKNKAEMWRLPRKEKGDHC